MFGRAFVPDFRPFGPPIHPTIPSGGPIWTRNRRYRACAGSWSRRTMNTMCWTTPVCPTTILTTSSAAWRSWRRPTRSWLPPILPLSGWGARWPTASRRCATGYRWRAFRTCSPWRSWRSSISGCRRLCRRALNTTWSPRWTACLWRWSMKTASLCAAPPAATDRWGRM